jgi:hypothetical protein
MLYSNWQSVSVKLDSDEINSPGNGLDIVFLQVML